MNGTNETDNFTIIINIVIGELEDSREWKGNLKMRKI